MFRSSGTRGEGKTQLLVFFFGLISVVLLTDQATKWLALSLLQSGTSYPVLPGIFHLTLVRNTGIAFGFFQQHPETLLILISVSLLFLGWIGYRICRHAEKNSKLIFQSPEVWAMGLILGGAFGNWLDRLRYQAVIDFLDFRIWPVFNFADTAITAGVILYGLVLVRRK